MRSPLRCLLSASLFVAACGDDDPGATSPKLLVSSAPAAVDGMCPAGGTTLAFGVDANGSGTLDADEVTATHVVCGPVTRTRTAPASAESCKTGTKLESGPDRNRNGTLDDDEVAHSSLICAPLTAVAIARTMTVEPGDKVCPFGGTRTETGLDDGANGAAAGDGILEHGEVRTSTLSCAPTRNLFPGTFLPPMGAPGTNRVLFSGGEGKTGRGGGSGPLVLSLGAGTRGGNIAVFRTGKADADFEMTPPTPSFGTTKLDLTTDRRIARRQAPSEAAPGEYYVMGASLYVKASELEPAVPVDGIHVPPNVTLTLPGDEELVLTADIHNEGTITVPLSAEGDRASLKVRTSGRYIGGPASKIDLVGRPYASIAGGSGGALELSARAIFDAGTIDTSGAARPTADALAGGAAGNITLSAALPGYGPIERTGAIKGAGGSGKKGGRGADLYLSSNLRGVRLKGAIEQSGGAGGASGGGDAGTFSVTSNVGEVRFAGSLVRRGGDVDVAACPTTCEGGRPMGFQLHAHGGDVRWAGDVVASGGRSKGTAGGGGECLSVFALDGEDPLTGARAAAGSIHVSGTLDLRGGEGSVGGSACEAVFAVDTERPRGQELLFFGYESIDLSGGRGATDGGWAGDLTFGEKVTAARPGGSVINYAAIVAKGGAASTSGVGVGGTGGLLSFATLPTSEVADAAVVSVGPIDASGGDGVSEGGRGGRISLYSHDRVMTFGAITAYGGASSGASSKGGTVYSSAIEGGDVTLDEAFVARGGDGEGANAQGGDCGGLEVKGREIHANAPVSCAGGNGSGARGGHGGPVTVRSSSKRSVTNGVFASGGAGTPSGDPGAITVD